MSSNNGTEDEGPAADLPSLDGISGDLAHHSAMADHNLIPLPNGQWICNDCSYCEVCGGPCRDESADYASLDLL